MSEVQVCLGWWRLRADGIVHIVGEMASNETYRWVDDCGGLYADSGCRLSGTSCHDLIDFLGEELQVHKTMELLSSPSVDWASVNSYRFVTPRKRKPVVQEKEQILREPVEEEQHPLKRQVGGDHYMDMGIQPIDVMKAAFTSEQLEGFLRGNVLKYLMRYPQKNGVTDVKKAQHYMEMLIKHLEKESTEGT